MFGGNVIVECLLKQGAKLKGVSRSKIEFNPD